MEVRNSRRTFGRETIQAITHLCITQMSQSVLVAITQGLGGLNSKHLFLTVVRKWEVQVEGAKKLTVW